MGIKLIKRYSEAVKRQVVEEFEEGSNVRELLEQYNITSKGSVYEWRQKYGRNQRATKVVRVIMKSEKELIGELNRTVIDLTLRNRVMEAELQLWEEEGERGLKKKLSTKRLKELERLKAKRLAIRFSSSVSFTE